MKKRISRDVLEYLYAQCFSSFLDGFATMWLEFELFFDKVVIPDYNLSLIDNLDPVLSYALLGFSAHSKQNFYLNIHFHFHIEYYQIDIQIDDVSVIYSQQWNYDTVPDKDDYFGLINQTGQYILNNIQQQYKS